MRGLVPTVKTVGLITAENPGGIDDDVKSNKEANKKLEKELGIRGYGYTKVTKHVKKKERYEHKLKVNSLILYGRNSKYKITGF